LKKDEAEELVVEIEEKKPAPVRGASKIPATTTKRKEICRECKTARDDDDF
jgi:hypothetical protein